MTDTPGWDRDRDRSRDSEAGPSPAPVPPGWSPVQPPPSPPSAWQPHDPPGPPGSPPPSGPGSAYGGAPGWGPPGSYAPPPPPKPGIIPLRPLGVGELLDGAISSLRANPGAMLGLSAVLAALTQLVQVPVSYLLLRERSEAVFSGPTTAQQDIELLADTFVSVGPTLVMTLLATAVLTGILTVVVSRAVLGQKVTAGGAWAKAKPRIPALLGVTVLFGLIVFAAGALPFLPALLVGLSGAPVGITVVLALAGLLAAVVLAPWLYVMFALAPPALVLEKQPVIASLRRSRTLVGGAWWRTFGLLLLVLVITQIIAGIVALPFSGGAFVLGVASGDPNPYNLLPLLLTAVGTIVGATVTWPFAAAATALVYVDRRMRREGLDIELARASGRMPQGTTPTPGAGPQSPQSPPYGPHSPPYGPQSPQSPTYGPHSPPYGPPPRP